MMPKKTFYRIEVALAECPFEVTRTLIVPADIRLDYLHEVLQTAMGWRDSHLHEFQSKTKRYGVKSGEDDEISDERRVRLSGIVKPKDPYCGYIYDYGDEWVHQLHVVDFDCGGACRQNVGLPASAAKARVHRRMSEEQPVTPTSAPRSMIRKIRNTTNRSNGFTIFANTIVL